MTALTARTSWGEVVARFENPRERSDKTYLVRCPSCRKKDATLTRGDRGRFFVKCWNTACTQEAILTAVGLQDNRFDDGAARRTDRQDNPLQTGFEMSSTATAAVPRPTLCTADQDRITGSAITPEIAAHRGYCTVTSADELKRLGFADYQARPGLLIPVYSVTGEQALYQLRPHKPRMFTDDTTGKRKEIKYETPAGGVMQIDLHPAARPMLADVQTDLWITEGIRKGDAAVSAGLCCLALLGVWNWRRDGAPLPEWQHIPLVGRRVNIGFDSDVMVKPEVAKALRSLRHFLQEHGAEVWLCYLPDENGAKVGLDDFLAAGGTVADLEGFCQQELRHTPEESEESEPLRNLRKNELGRRLRGLADVQPHGGLKLNKGLTPLELQRACKTVGTFYGHIEDALKWDILDLWVAAAAVMKPGHREVMNLRQQLFGRHYRQVGNWLYAVGDFAANADGRRRPHLPFWLHGCVRDLDLEQQEQVFDTYEASGHMSQDDVRILIATLTGEPEVADETRRKVVASPSSADSNVVGGHWQRLAQICDEETAEALLRLVQARGAGAVKGLVRRYADELQEAEEAYPWPEDITDEWRAEARQPAHENAAENDGFEIENPVPNYTAVYFEPAVQDVESPSGDQGIEEFSPSPPYDSISVQVDRQSVFLPADNTPVTLSSVEPLPPNAFPPDPTAAVVTMRADPPRKVPLCPACRTRPSAPYFYYCDVCGPARDPIHAYDLQQRRTVISDPPPTATSSGTGGRHP